MSQISKTPVQRDIPGEPGEWMKFFKLSAKKLRKAADAKQARIFETIPAEACAAIITASERARNNSDNDNGDDASDPAAEYDHETLLKLSLDSWSYKTPPGNDPSDQIELPTLEWAANEIVSLSAPPTKADLKNSASVSTSP